MIISKKPPYQNTTVDPEKTQSDINKMLRAYGVTAYQWTTNYDLNQVSLAFRVENEENGKKRVYNVRMSPPTFAMQRKTYNPKTGRHEKQDLPNWAASFRFLYNRIKSKLEEVAYGGSTTEEAFLSDIILPNGGTLYEALKRADVFEKGLFLEGPKPEPEQALYRDEKPTDAIEVEARMVEDEGQP